MKLNKSTLLETLRKLNNGETAYQARKVAGISVRRVYQIKEIYEATGGIPEIGKQTGRPIKMIEQWEIDIVKEAYGKYRVSADTLERVIDWDYGKHIGHNRIHRILIELGFAKPKEKKDIRKKKWIRYERRHSLTAVHIDWHYYKGTWVFGVEDDASRKLLALTEDKQETTDKSIEGMEIALKHVRLVSEEQIKGKMEEANKFLGKVDPDDVIFLATAFSIDNSKIWSDDPHLEKQDRVRVFKTKHIMTLFFPFEEK